MYIDYYLALNSAMALTMPELLFRGISMIYPSALFFFYTLFKTVLCLADWSCCWPDDFGNLCWLCLNSKQRFVCSQLSSKVSSWGNFYSHYDSLIHVNLSQISQFILFCSAEFISLRDNAILWDWSVRNVRLTKAIRPTLHSLPSKFMYSWFCSSACILSFYVIFSWKTAICTILTYWAVWEGVINLKLFCFNLISLYAPTRPTRQDQFMYNNRKTLAILFLICNTLYDRLQSSWEICGTK